MARIKDGFNGLLFRGSGWMVAAVLAAGMIAIGFAAGQGSDAGSEGEARSAAAKAEGSREAESLWARLVSDGQGAAVSTDNPGSDGNGDSASNAQPETVDDLRRLQQRTRAVVEQAMPATVGLRIGSAQGSGVIVSADGLVLTAGHVSGSPGRRATVILHDGTRLEGETLGRNHGMDSGMIQITADPPEGDEFPYVPLGRSNAVEPGGWCVALGHPGGYERGREPVVRLGRVVRSTRRVIWSDCTLVGGDSGGPLFNLEGEVIGIHSRISMSTSGNFHVPIDTYHDTWDRLAEGEAWGLGSGEPRAFLGVAGEDHQRGCLVTRVLPNTAAAEAGLREGDIITRWEGRRIRGIDALIEAIRESSPGDRIEIRYLRDGERATVRLELGSFGSGD